MSLASSRWCTAFTEPAVPTGIKIGVSMAPCSVSINPALALVAGSVACSENFMKVKEIELLPSCCGWGKAAK